MDGGGGLLHERAPAVVATDDEVGRAVLAFRRLTQGLTDVATRTMGDGTSQNARVEILLSVHARRGILASELATAMGLPRSVISRNLVPLVEQGLVTRRPRPEDRRARELVISRKGTRRVERFVDEAQVFCHRQEVALAQALAPWWAAEPREHDEHATVLQCMADLARVGEAAGAALGRRLVDEGVPCSEVEHHALRFLQVEEGWSRPSVLAEELGLSRQGASDLVSRLEGRGLVRRSEPGGRADGRTVVVELDHRGSLVVAIEASVLAPRVPELAAAVWAMCRSAG